MPGPTSISGSIAARAAEAPDSPAIAAPGREPLTYAGLVRHVDRAAAALRALGVAREDRVAVVLPNGPEACTAFLAVSAAAQCAPLNPAYREAELDFYFTDLAAKALVVEQGRPSPAREVARRLGIRVLELALPGGGPAGLFDLQGMDGAEAPQPAPGDVALVLHTSGTTSRPKLVPLTHANLCASASNVAGALELSPGDRCLNVMPLFHVHGLVAAVLASLSAGGTVACAPGLDPERFAAWVEELGPTWYTAVPTMHQAILARAARGGGIAGAALRLVRSSSAPLPPQVHAELERAFGCPAVEAYGMTEASHQIASNPLPPAKRKPGSVGLPTGVEVAILDGEGRSLPDGETGEVAVRGPGVFAGYGDPAATREAFVDGWFRTGDLGSIDGDGYLFLRGRLKEIINRGGEKVSPREIDEVLLEHPAVAQAVTFALPDGRLGEEVAAAVVLREGASASERSLQEFASERLADFKVPRSVVFLDELPKGPTGKVQRIGLADELGLAVPAPASRAPYVPPRTPLERKIAERLEELLGADRVGADDDFFQLGGDSMSAAALLAWIADAGLGPEDLPQSTLLWAPTVARLAQALEDGGPAPGPIVPIDLRGTKSPLFFAHGHDGDAVTYGPLARRLTAGHPFYGIVADPAARPESVESLGRAYAEEIRRTQPAGPYYLGGWCMGGAIALETARCFLEAGEEVGLLALIDPIGEPPVGPVRHYWRRFRRYREQRTVIRAIRRIRTMRRWIRQTRLEAARRETDLHRAMTRASSTYRPRPFPGRITLLSGDYYMTPPSYWRRIADRGVDAYPPAGRNLGRPPAVDVLAAQLDEALRKARS